MKAIFRKISTFVTQSWDTDPNEQKMSFFDHLEELRYRLIVILATFLACFLAIYPFAESLFIILRKPIAEQLYMLSPAEAFVVYLKIAMFGGLIVSLPMTLYQLWAFVAPGLYRHEKRYGVAFIALGMLFFSIGGGFAYAVVLPFGLKFLLGYGGDLIKPIISVSNYITFATTTISMFGVVFELPLLAVFLARMGIITPALLKAQRRMAILGAFVVGAIFSPPDAFSQILLAVPLVILYEISIWACVVFGKKAAETDELQE